MGSKFASRWRSGLSTAVGTAALLVLQGCSGSGPRDQNWGSEVGRDAGAAPASDAEDAAPDQTEEDVADEMDTSPDTGGDANDANGDVASDGETMDGDAMTAQYTGGSPGGAGAAQ